MKHYNIPIFVPHRGCPNDCVFCNQKKITGISTDVTPVDIINTIEEYLKTLPKNNRTVEVAFFGGSFTGIDFDVQEQFLSTAHEYIKSGLIDGIRISTRPDYITKDILKQLKKYGVTTIELGVQSLDDNVLVNSNRGHSSIDVYNAVSLIKEYDFSLGLQMMTGLPGDSDDSSINTAKKIIALSPDFVRIYPTLVLKNTKLEQMYKDGKYIPQSLDDAVLLCKKLLMLFRENSIPVIRIALQTTDEICPGGSYIAGPYDAQFRELVESSIFYDKFSQKLYKSEFKEVIALVNTKEVSKAIGRNKSNIIRINKKFNIDFKVKGDDNILPDEFEIIGK